MSARSLATLLLDWYARCGRDLPWRTKGGAHPDPYVVLVSEFMLQQTTVKTVIPYFARFMSRFPTLKSLADADIEDVYACWQGLGYYTRARSLHASAQMIAAAGQWPQTPAEALRLKGFGNYTAASFVALAFNRPAVVVDGNVRRIMCRMFALNPQNSDFENTVFKSAAKISDTEHAADYASALMDLGALICTPKKPQCRVCPWQRRCLSAGRPDIEQILPHTKPEKKLRFGTVRLIFNPRGEVFIRRRTEKGLLSGLWEFPWTDNEPPFAAETCVTHTFTHIRLTLRLSERRATAAPTEGVFVSPAELARYPLSTLMKKVWRAHLKSAAKS